MDLVPIPICAPLLRVYQKSETAPGVTFASNTGWMLFLPKRDLGKRSETLVEGGLELIGIGNPQSVVLSPNIL